MKELLDNRTGKLIEPKTVVSYCRSQNLLVFSFEAYDSSLNSFSNIDNDTIYKGDVVEVFLDLGEEHYYEFEVAPNGTVFVAKIVNFTPVFIPRDFFKSHVEIKGNNYFVEMIIDLSVFENTQNIKFNAFRIETKGIKSDYILQALSPTLSNSFHVRDRFIKL